MLPPEKIKGLGNYEAITCLDEEKPVIFYCNVINYTIPAGKRLVVH